MRVFASPENRKIMSLYSSVEDIDKKERGSESQKIVIDKGRTIRI